MLIYRSESIGTVNSNAIAVLFPTSLQEKANGLALEAILRADNNQAQAPLRLPLIK
jgi:hypothetical protein